MDLANQHFKMTFLGSGVRKIDEYVFSSVSFANQVKLVCKIFN